MRACFDHLVVGSHKRSLGQISAIIQWMAADELSSHLALADLIQARDEPTPFFAGSAR
jgi:hypothetical protein